MIVVYNCVCSDASQSNGAVKETAAAAPERFGSSISAFLNNIILSVDDLTVRFYLKCAVVHFVIGALAVL